MAGRGPSGVDRRAGWRLAATLLVLALAIGPSAAHAAPNDGPAELTACPVVAGAQAMTTTVQKDGDLVLARPTGGQVPAAQMCLDAALGESTAYASAAYPGATVVSAPGAAADFPGYVSSSYPGTPDAKADGSAYVLQAHSAEDSSQATAQAGPPSVGTSAGTSSAEAKGSVDTAAGTATARGAAVSTPFDVAGVLALGEVRSSAEARATTDGQIQRSSMLEIGRSSVSGQSVTITPAGVQAAGQALPLPPASNVNDLLATAGVTVTYLSAEKTPNGIVSAGLRISVVAKDSAGVRTVTSYVLGRSFAAVARPRQESSAGTPSNSVPGGSSAPVGGALTGQRATGPLEAATGSAQSPTASPELASSAPSGEVPPQVAAGHPPVLLAGSFRGTLGSLYPVLVVGGLVLLVSCTSVRLLGVRTRWTS